MNFTDHQLLAAVRVARIIDNVGNATQDLHNSFRLIPTQGQHRSDDLLGGEQILETIGLIAKTNDDRVESSARLQVLGALSDRDALALLRRILSRRSRDAKNFETGLLGELEVVRYCAEELNDVGRADLARSVQQVSLLDDSLGYDVLAPMISGEPRHLEVKTSQAPELDTFEFFLSRNEFDTGRRDDTWALVACRRFDGGKVKIIGWCRAQSLYPYLPEDGGGRWTEAKLQLPTSVLFDNIPPPV